MTDCKDGGCDIAMVMEGKKLYWLSLNNEQIELLRRNRDTRQEMDEALKASGLKLYTMYRIIESE